MEVVCQILHRGILFPRDIWQYLDIIFIVTLGAEESYWHRQVEGRYAASVIQCKDSSPQFHEYCAKYCAVDKPHCFDESQNLSF